MKKLILLAIALLLIPNVLAVSQFSVGVSPSLLDLGEIPYGSSKPAKFHVVTVSDETLLVYLEAQPSLIDFFSSPAYKDYIYNYSEEDPSSWVKVFSNPVELKPITELQTLGGAIKGWRDVNFLVEVPKNAEPGYHLIKLLPKPALPSNSLGQVGVGITALTPITVLLKTPGEAIRDGKILDITVGRYLTNGVEIYTHFLNTGTVTISARAKSVEVYDKNGTLITTLTSDTKKVLPGEKTVLTSFIPYDALGSGEYDVSSTVDFITGETQKSATIKIYPKIMAAPAPPVAKPLAIPWWVLVVIVIIIISVIIYWRGHEE